MDKDTIYERPTYAKWKRTHERYVQKSHGKYDAKKDTRKSYHWVVLTFLQYSEELKGKEQPTWFYGSGGRPTAFGTILSTWWSYGKKCFLVNARNRRTKDIYLVVFSADGSFITAYSKTKDDIPDKLFRIPRRRAYKLLRLSASVGDSNPRRITEQSILKLISGKKAHNIVKALTQYLDIVIPTGVELGLVKKEGDSYFFTMGCDDIEAEIHDLNLFGWKDFIWAKRQSEK